MTHDQLMTLMQEPHRLEASHIPALHTLVEAYPYASSFVFLYLYALAQTQDVRYASELRRLSIYLPRRDELYRLVEGQGISSEPHTASPAEASEGDDAFAMIDRFLDGARASGADLPDELGFDTVDRGDYFASTTSTPLEATAGDELPDLIPDENPHETSRPTESATVSAPHAVAPAEETVSTPQVATALTPSEEEAEPVTEELFTETLARIYIKQGRYDKALRIIKTISLNYPKKNRYFADQIRFLERLIDSNIDNKQ